MEDKKRHEAQSVGEAIRQLLNSYQLTNKFDEASLIASWEQIVGKPIASRTRNLYIRNKVLFVELESPSMKHDFSMHKAQILDMFRTKFGSNVITDIIVM